MKPTADLSVVMPTYNHARYLPRALGALLDQSLVPAEIIVVNDASPDDTSDILERYSRDYPVVKVITNDRNRGANEGIRVGLAQASGKYVFCTASDDYVLPGFVEKMVGTLEQYPRAGLCSAYFSIVNGVSGEIRPNVSGWCTAPRYFSPAEVERLIGHTSVPGHASILKRSSFEAAGGFLPDLEWHSDWFLNFVVAFREGICHVPETLSLLTEMSSSYAGQGTQSERQTAVINAIFDRLASATYADVAPFFQRSGVLSVLGLPVLRAAAMRADAETRDLLSLINGFTTEQYEALLSDPEPRVRELGGFFLGPFRDELKQRRQTEIDEVRGLRQALLAKAQLGAELQSALADERQARTQQEQRNTELEQCLVEVRQRAAELEQGLADAQQRLAAAEELQIRSQRILADRHAQLQHADVAIAQLNDAVRKMESSYFWKLRKLFAAVKHALPAR